MNNQRWMGRHMEYATFLVASGRKAPFIFRKAVLWLCGAVMLSLILGVLGDLAR